VTDGGSAAPSARFSATPEDPPLTLGTAGHVDHGKTALITLLTGKNTDRLREERERGVSIELGYAELELPTGRRLSVVDVPGHERFVRTMVAGATGIDVFLLVVAADDGVMPQTREHVAILELLGVPRGVVAITKADLVDDEMLQLVRADVTEFLAGTAYAQSPVAAVSARDGRGIPGLLGHLEEVSAAAAAERRAGPARLPVDRSFALKGIGAVVTGTVWRGEIRAGDALLVQPGGKQVTVRSVQVHDRDAEAALAGQRAGVNLRGVEKSEVERGQWLVGVAETGAVTRVFDAWIKLLPDARPLRSDAQVRLHHGTGQRLARLGLLGARELAPGAEALVRVRLNEAVALEAHDRFIVRSLSPVATVGGGVVLDAVARRWHSRTAQGLFLAALHAGDAERAALELAAARTDAGLAAGDLLGARVHAFELTPLLAAAEQRGALESLAGLRAAAGEQRWFVPGTLTRLRGVLLAALADRARRRPERPFMPAAELAALVPGLPPAAVGALLDGLVAEAQATAGEGGYAAAPAVAGALSPAQETLAAAAGERLAGAGLAPPTLATLADELGAPRAAVERVLAVLTRRGELVRAEKDLWFAVGAVTAVREKLLAALAADGQITLAGFRDLAATGRRNAQALLELFDREGLTRRQGDVRVPRGRRV
jgi:selenocysteine-specific elongation factor